MIDHNDRTDGTEKTFPMILNSILDEWSEFNKYQKTGLIEDQMDSMPPSKLFHHDHAIGAGVGSGSSGNGQSLLVGPSLDLSHGLVGQQLSNLGRVYSRMHSHAHSTTTPFPVVMVLSSADLTRFSSNCEGKLDLKHQIAHFIGGGSSDGTTDKISEYRHGFGNRRHNITTTDTSTMTYVQLKPRFHSNSNSNLTHQSSKKSIQFMGKHTSKYLPMNLETNEWLHAYYQKDHRVLTQLLM